MELLRKYGVGVSFEAPMIKRNVVDFAVGADWTPAAGDVKVIKDGGSPTNIGTLPTAVASGNGATWLWTLSATEMQAARVAIVVVDAATKAVEDNELNLLTFGNASAYFVSDLAAAALASDVTKWNGTALATPDTAGYPKVTIKDGTGVGELDTASGVVLAKDHSGANLATASALATVQADTDDLQTRVPAALVGGRMDASVGAMAAAVLTAAAIATDAITAAKIAADAITAAKIADGAIDAATFAAGAINAAAIAADAITDAKVASDVTIASVTGAVGSVAGNVGGNVVGSIGSVAAGGIAAASFAAGAIDAAAIADSAIDAATFAAGAINAAAIATDAITAAKIATDAIGSAELAATAVSKIRDAILSDATTFAGADIALIKGYVDELETRLTAARAGYLDNLSGGAVALNSDIATLLGRITATRAGYLDNLSGGAVALQATLTTVAGYLDTEIAQLLTDTAALLARLTSGRAGYLDNLSAGAVALQSTLAALNNLSAANVLTQVNAALTATIADSVPADGTRPSIAAGIYILVQYALERAVSGTTMTLRKPDGTTALLTCSLDSATAPTSVTRET